MLTKKIRLKVLYLPTLFTFVSLALAAYAYSIIPERSRYVLGSLVWTHGRVYVPKPVALFFLPVLMLALCLLFSIFPRLDKENPGFEKFNIQFGRFSGALFVFLFYLYTVVLLSGINRNVNLAKFVILAFTVFFYTLGVLVSNMEYDWKLGIRNRWTLRSREVWTKTHSFAGALLRILSIVSLFGLFFADFYLLPVVIGVIFIFVAVIIYSCAEGYKTAKI